LNLDPHQSKQAETQKQSADGVVTARIPEAYQWLLVPVQSTPQATPEWQAMRLTGSDPLAVRASRKLKNDELLITSFAATRLRMELDRVPLWRGDHVALKQLVEDFGRYLYLPRLAEPSVLVEAIRDGLALLTWDEDAFVYAESFDEEARRYRGLRGGQQVTIPGAGSPALLVKPSVARPQIEAEAAAAAGATGAGVGAGGGAGGVGVAGPGPGAGPGAPPPPPVPQKRARRFYGSVELNPMRLGGDAGKIAEEVIAHMVGLPGARVKVTLDIEATMPEGAPDHVVRVVTENGRTLKFSAQGFEVE